MKVTSKEHMLKSKTTPQRNMKIGVITILNVNNYGAELQAFALHHKLKLMGYDNEIINYLYYKNPNYITEAASKPVVRTSVKNKLKDFVLKYIDKYSAMRYPAVSKIRKERFKDFHEQHTALSATYNSYSSLYKAKTDYDIYIVGSDQVWNPNNGTNLAPYFLTFAPAKAKKISYASSFGVGTIAKSLHPQYKKWIDNIDHLSTREQDGVEIIKEIAGKKAEHVVDPTLLLSKQEWEKVMVPFEYNAPYILLFVFKQSPFVMELARKIQKQTGYKIIRVCKNEMPVDKDKDILNIRDFGPAEFLGLIANASFVITTSFHGTVFSLIFEKPFYTVTPASKNNNSRQENLLTMLDLQDNLIHEDGEVYPNTTFDIDYNIVNNRLQSEQNKSISFLLKSINS